MSFMYAIYFLFRLKKREENADKNSPGEYVFSLGRQLFAA